MRWLSLNWARPSSHNSRPNEQRQDLRQKMKDRLTRWLPDPQTLQQSRWLRWMGPALQHPRLWRMSRKGIALGLALGIFFGLLIPVAQIPCSAGMAVLLRANLPAAVASTLVTNPVTFGPVYFGAYHLGKRVLGEDVKPGEIPPDLPLLTSVAPNESATARSPEDTSWLAKLKSASKYLTTVGKPLVVGLAITACVSGIVVYALTTGVWILAVRLKRRHRLRLAQS